MTTTSPFLWNRSSKIKFFTNIWYSFCQRLLRPANFIFLKLFDETQISEPPEAYRHHKSKEILVLLSLRANSKNKIQCETPCTWLVIEWILVFCDCLFIKFSEYHSLDYFEIWDIVNSWNYTMNSINLCLISYLFAIYYWAGINIFFAIFYKYVRTKADKIMIFWILVQICDIVNSWNFVMNRSNCIYVVQYEDHSYYSIVAYIGRLRDLCPLQFIYVIYRSS